MRTLTLLDKNDPRAFKIASGAVKAIEHKDATSGKTKKLIVGIASSTVVDRHGDTITESAQLQMLDAAKGLTMWLNHSYKVPEDVLGTCSQSDLQRAKDATGECIDLHIVCEVDDDNPRALKSWQHIQNGTKLAFSIGGYFTDVDFVDPDDWWSALIVNGIDLLEISLVGIPANPRAYTGPEKAVGALKDGFVGELAWSAREGIMAKTLGVDRENRDALMAARPEIANNDHAQTFIAARKSIFAVDEDPKPGTADSTTLGPIIARAAESAPTAGLEDAPEVEEEPAPSIDALAATPVPALTLVESADGYKLTLDDASRTATIEAPAIALEGDVTVPPGPTLDQLAATPAPVAEPAPAVAAAPAPAIASDEKPGLSAEHELRVIEGMKGIVNAANSVHECFKSFDHMKSAHGQLMACLDANADVPPDAAFPGDNPAVEPDGTVDGEKHLHAHAFGLSPKAGDVLVVDAAIVDQEQLEAIRVLFAQTHPDVVLLAISFEGDHVKTIGAELLKDVLAEREQLTTQVSGLKDELQRLQATPTGRRTAISGGSSTRASGYAPKNLSRHEATAQLGAALNGAQSDPALRPA